MDNNQTFINNSIDKLINDIKQEQLRILNRNTADDEARENDSKYLIVLNRINSDCLKLKSGHTKKPKK